MNARGAWPLEIEKALSGAEVNLFWTKCEIYATARALAELDCAVL